ncbi:hypothetical protein M2360_004298 [Rhizobium sp. SG_E_25_P2]|nr:hypothetical protein [Rhizobium sp. SG_E_25_P2]
MKMFPGSLCFFSIFEMLFSAIAQLTDHSETKLTTLFSAPQT